MALLLTPQWKRLLGFVRPYTFRLAVGVVLLGFVALAEGAVALLIVPIFDRVLNPTSSDSTTFFRTAFITSGRLFRFRCWWCLR